VKRREIRTNGAASSLRDAIDAATSRWRFAPRWKKGSIDAIALMAV
jgi:hypothetical protein